MEIIEIISECPADISSLKVKNFFFNKTTLYTLLIIKFDFLRKKIYLIFCQPYEGLAGRNQKFNHISKKKKFDIALFHEILYRKDNLIFNFCQIFGFL